MPRWIDFVVGLFMVAGIAAMGYLAVNLGNLQIGKQDVYTLHASFPSVSGLKLGAQVELAGVPVGRVTFIAVDGKLQDRADVDIEVRGDIKLPDDTFASVRTQGIIGDKYIQLTPGGSLDILADGDEITETEGSLQLEELISKYIFEKDK